MSNAAFDLVGMARDMRKLVYCTDTERAEKKEENRVAKSNKVFIERAQNFIKPLQKKRLDLSPRK